MIDWFYRGWKWTPFLMVAKLLGRSLLGTQEQDFEVDSPYQWEFSATKC